MVDENLKETDIDKVFLLKLLQEILLYINYALTILSSGNSIDIYSLNI